MIGTTFDGNNAALFGGGIHFNRFDLDQDHAIKIRNSTISGNSADLGAGLFNVHGLAAIEYSTITSNSAVSLLGSGVASRVAWYQHDVNTEVSSSIIAGNTGSDVDFVDGVINSFSSLGYNLIGNGNALANL